MAKILKSLVVIVAGVLLYLLMPATPVLAVANPNSTSIGDAYVFEDVLESGDILVYVRYDVDYGTQPDEDSEDTYQMVVYDTDGSTVLAGPRGLNYYQHNIISIYLDADDNTLTTGSAYYVRIMGDPAVFDPLVEDTNMDTRVLAPGDYRDAADLQGIMVTQAEILEADWGTTLLTSSDRLNSTGAFYFQKAIPGLASMVSDLFEVSTAQFTYTRNQSIPREGLNRTIENLPISLNNAMAGLNQMLGATENQNWGQFGWLLFMSMILGGGVYAASRRPDVAVLGGVVGGMSLGAYMGLASGNALLFLMAVGTIIIVIFAVEFVLPRFG